ncbi:MAG: hypothetical protein ACI3VB_07895 [Oscillospiraceae bacterium]
MLSSGIIAALADGPLVAGDIYAISISLCQTSGAIHHDPHNDEHLNNYLPHYHFKRAGVKSNTHAW